MYSTTPLLWIIRSNCRLLYTRVADIYAKNCAQENTAVAGWVKSIRKMKEVIFFDVSDGSYCKKLQVVCPKILVPESLKYGASVKVEGEILLSQSGQIELHATKLDIVGECVVTDGFPFLPRKHYPSEYVRKFLHHRSRTESFSTFLRIRDKLTNEVRNYFSDEGFIGIHTPVITSNDCEGAGEVFQVLPNDKDLIERMRRPHESPEESFFGKKAYLTVSSQLHLECLARGLSKVYCLGPTFRSENSRSRLHLSEFYMVEAEIAFMDNLNELLNVIERFVKHLTKKMLDSYEEEISYYRKLTSATDMDCVTTLVEKPFAIMDYDDVYSVLEKHNDQFTSHVNDDKSLTKEHELFLVKYNDNRPVFVINWPKQIKPFYMKQTQDKMKVYAVDLLLPNIGEMVGGSLREDDYSTLEENLISHNLEERLSWYLELRKFGSVPTGGFGMGFERYIQILLGCSNIKDVIPFPRWPHTCRL